jgi:hypothetical protein
MPPAHVFLSIFFHNVCSQVLLPFCRNAEVIQHVVATFIELQEANSQNTAVLLFQKIPVIQGCRTSINKCDPIRLLPNSPQHKLKTGAEYYTVLPRVAFCMPNSVNLFVGNTTSGKLRLTREQNVRHNL